MPVSNPGKNISRGARKDATDFLACFLACIQVFRKQGFRIFYASEKEIRITERTKTAHHISSKWLVYKHIFMFAGRLYVPLLEHKKLFCFYFQLSPKRPFVSIIWRMYPYCFFQVENIIL